MTASGELTSQQVISEEIEKIHADSRSGDGAAFLAHSYTGWPS